MAFEDRSSPNTANSPGIETGLIQTPNSPESTRTTPYTCTTITQKSPMTSDEDGQQETCVKNVNNNNNSNTGNNKSIFRITSFALPPSPNNTKSTDDDAISVKSYVTSSEASSNQNDDDEIEEVPTIQTLKYSIWNILQPDFGKSALQKTRYDHHHRHHHAEKITFKPYECVTGKQQQQAPLGSLCRTVSQIGKGIQQDDQTKTNATAIPTTTTTTSGGVNDTKQQQQSTALPNPEDVKEEGKVPTLWPAWVYCTRYSDRPSSGNKKFKISFLILFQLVPCFFRLLRDLKKNHPVDFKTNEKKRVTKKTEQASVKYVTLKLFKSNMRRNGRAISY